MSEFPVATGPSGLLITTQAFAMASTTTTNFSIVREISLTNLADRPIEVSVGIDKTANTLGAAVTDTDAKHFIHKATVQPGDPKILDGFWPLNPHATTPDRLYAIINAPTTDWNSTVNIFVSLVTGP